MKVDLKSFFFFFTSEFFKTLIHMWLSKKRVWCVRITLYYCPSCLKVLWEDPGFLLHWPGFGGGRKEQKWTCAIYEQKFDVSCVSTMSFSSIISQHVPDRNCSLSLSLWMKTWLQLTVMSWHEENLLPFFVNDTDFGGFLQQC